MTVVRCCAIVSNEEIRMGFVVVPEHEIAIAGAQCPNEADYVFTELGGQKRAVALCDQHTYAFLNRPSMPIVELVR